MKKALTILTLLAAGCVAAAVTNADRLAVLSKATGKPASCFDHIRGATFVDTCDGSKIGYAVYKGSGRECPPYGEPIASDSGWTVCRGK
jgi:hypothetical protein